MYTSSIAESLASARQEKDNDYNSWLWKGVKSYKNGQVVQDQFLLKDGTPQQLINAYKHCDSMLNSTDKNKLGRNHVLTLIKDQMNRCSAELYIRYLQNPDDGRNPYPIHLFFQDLRQFLDKPSTLEMVPRSTWDTAAISRVAAAPAEFSELPINLVLDACLSNLGVFRKNHITLALLTKFGLWFTKDEIKEYLTKYDENGNLMDKLDVLKENLGIRPEVMLHTDKEKGLSYLQFRAIYQLHDMRYNEMTPMQLKTLLHIILPTLFHEVCNHRDMWIKKQQQIEYICELRGISLS